MSPQAPISHIVFQDPGATGLGRVSAATRKTSLTQLAGRRLDCYALVYLVGGSGSFEDALGNSARLTAGDAFLLFPGTQHGYGPNQGDSWEEIYILFEGPLFDLWRKKQVINEQHPLYRLEPIEYWRERIFRIWKEEIPALNRMIRMQGLLAEMNTARDEQHTSQPQKAWMQEARTRLAEHASERGAVQAVAREMGMSYQTFRKTFSHLQGVGPSRFCAEKVIETAARRLMEEQTPIKQIAGELGFVDEHHFSRAFKRHLGISPGSYRRRVTFQ